MSKITSRILLAGGYGTRLKSVVPDRQKVVADVEGRPFLQLILEQLAGSGITKLVLCVHYLGEQVRELIGDSYKNIKIEYSFEESPLGTAGAIKQAWRQHFSHEPYVLAMNGDSLCLTEFAHYFHWYEAHTEHPFSSLLLTQVEDISRYGNVHTDEHANITSFQEKGGIGFGYINAGVYLLNQEFMASIPDHQAVSMEKEMFPQWIGKGLKGHKVSAPFIDIGVPESYAAAADFLKSYSSPSPKKVVLIDRDGTIIVEKVYLHDPDQVELIPGAVDGLKLLKLHGYLLFVVTNQSGVSRKYYPLDDVHAVHKRIQEMLEKEGVQIDDFFICPHQDEDDCSCRKPRTGLALQVQGKYKVNLHDVVMIGDKECDVAMGQAVGAKSILVRTGYGRDYERDGHSADVVTDNLLTASHWILEHAGLSPN